MRDAAVKARRGGSHRSVNVKWWQAVSAVVPITLVAGAWGVAISASPGTDTVDAELDASPSDPGTPAITDVPTDAFDRPMAGEVKKRQSGHHPLAGLQLPGKKHAGTVAASLQSSPLPTPALDAYHDAAKVMADVKASCNLDWTLVAAIGRVESDHGQYAGSTVASGGESSPKIIGIPLDGSNDTAAIHDTDDGKYDGDTVWDRAVGPMQFIPSTWDLVGVDGNGDGTKDPNNIYDAALATSVYLCADGEDVSTHEGASEAVFSYNHSNSYVANVLAIAQAYRHGDFEETPGVLPQTDIVPHGTVFDPNTVAPETEPDHRLKSMELRSETEKSGRDESARDKSKRLQPMHRESHKFGNLDKAKNHRKPFQVEPVSPDGFGTGPIKQQDLETVHRGDAKPADPTGTHKPDHTQGFAEHHPNQSGQQKPDGQPQDKTHQQNADPKGPAVDIRPDWTLQPGTSDDTSGPKSGDSGGTNPEQQPKHKGQGTPRTDPSTGPGVDIRPKHRADDKTTKPEQDTKPVEPAKPKQNTKPTQQQNAKPAGPKAQDVAPQQNAEPADPAKPTQNAKPEQQQNVKPAGPEGQSPDTQSAQPKSQSTKPVRPKQQTAPTKPRAQDTRPATPKTEPEPKKPAPDTGATVRPRESKHHAAKAKVREAATSAESVEYASSNGAAGTAVERLIEDFSLFWSVPAQDTDTL